MQHAAGNTDMDGEHLNEKEPKSMVPFLRHYAATRNGTIIIIQSDATQRFSASKNTSDLVEDLQTTSTSTYLAHALVLWSF